MSTLKKKLRKQFFEIEHMRKKRKFEDQAESSQSDDFKRSVSKRNSRNDRKKHRKLSDSTQTSSKMSVLQRNFKEKLDGAQFRQINEKLYTSTGSDAFEFFRESPSSFETYHRGFASQVAKWPENPVKGLVQWLKSEKRSLTVGDFGCGTAELAELVSQRHTVHSFDLVAANERVTACDMAKVPLEAATLDVAIFCLSLMGTNFVDYLNEAHRVLKKGGRLKVVEVKSRFSDLNEFLEVCKLLGFELKNKNERNKMFIIFEFRKSSRPSNFKEAKRNSTDLLKACRYKKR
eukprot:139604_1